MKSVIFYCCLFFFSVTSFSQQKLQSVNAVLHDESYVAFFGEQPGGNTDEQLRIQAHLYYVELLLRNAPVNRLSATQQAKRAAVLDMLHEYLQAGKFPSNKDYPGERRPCFIDEDGNICAVGYLVEHTKGRELAETINQKHQYDFLADMNEPAINEWADEQGLTLEECAMIQPAYGPPPAPVTNHADIKTGYGVSSGIMGGCNLAFNVANLSGRFQHSKGLSCLGIITGAGQIILGAANIKKTETEYFINGGQVTTSYKKQNTLSYANIALGTTTVVSNVLNLVLNKTNKKYRNAFNLYSYPDYNNTVTMGLCFTRRI